MHVGRNLLPDLFLNGAIHKHSSNVFHVALLLLIASVYIAKGSPEFTNELSYKKLRMYLMYILMYIDDSCTQIVLLLSVSL